MEKVLAQIGIEAVIAGLKSLEESTGQAYGQVEVAKQQIQSAEEELKCAESSAEAMAWINNSDNKMIADAKKAIVKSEASKDQTVIDSRVRLDTKRAALIEVLSTWEAIKARSKANVALAELAAALLNNHTQKEK